MSPQAQATSYFFSPPNTKVKGFGADDSDWVAGVAEFAVPKAGVAKGFAGVAREFAGTAELPV